MNKRHYEHTLPNIRGSLSNTYDVHNIFFLGIKKIVEQQFNLAKIIIAHGLIPIIEPEVDIDAANKKQIETFMRNEILKHLDKTKKEDYLMFKFTLPEVPNYYNDLLRHKNVLRIVALSGGYERDLACQKLKQNKKMIASFSRA